MDESRDRHRTLMREIRRGVKTCSDAVFAWARDEPDAQRQELARVIAKALLGVYKGMAAYSGDGMIVPGDSRTLPPPRNQPPHDFTD